MEPRVEWDSLTCGVCSSLADSVAPGHCTAAAGCGPAVPTRASTLPRLPMTWSKRKTVPCRTLSGQLLHLQGVHDQPFRICIPLCTHLGQSAALNITRILTCRSWVSAPNPLARRRPSATERRLPGGGRVSLHSRRPRACQCPPTSPLSPAKPVARSARSGALNSACETGSFWAGEPLFCAPFDWQTSAER